MKTIIVGFVSLTIAFSASAWAQRRGASRSEVSRTTASGSRETHYEGGGTTATSHYGTTAYSSNYEHYYGGSYSSYHPPTTVNHYGASCYNCGGWAVAGAAATGAAVGATAGAAAASASAAGYAARNGATATYSMGAIYPTLPAGCSSRDVQGTTFYLCGSTWFSPSFGANGVYYRVVPAP